MSEETQDNKWRNRENNERIFFHMKSCFKCNSSKIKLAHTKKNRSNFFFTFLIKSISPQFLLLSPSLYNKELLNVEVD